VIKSSQPFGKIVRKQQAGIFFPRDTNFCSKNKLLIQ